MVVNLASDAHEAVFFEGEARQLKIEARTRQEKCCIEDFITGVSIL